MSMKRPDRAKRFKPIPLIETPTYAEHVNALGMICSLMGLLMKVRKCSFVTINTSYFPVGEIGLMGWCVLYSYIYV